jgi:hypothetical protein
LKNGGHYSVCAHNSETVVDTGMKFDTDVYIVVSGQSNLFQVAMSFLSKIAPVPKWRPLVLCLKLGNGHRYRHDFKFDSDVGRLVPENILQERMNLSYITTAMLENGGRYGFLLITLERLDLQELNLIDVR